MTSREQTREKLTRVGGDESFEEHSSLFILGDGLNNDSVPVTGQLGEVDD